MFFKFLHFIFLIKFFVCQTNWLFSHRVSSSRISVCRATNTTTQVVAKSKLTYITPYYYTVSLAVAIMSAAESSDISSITVDRICLKLEKNASFLMNHLILLYSCNNYYYYQLAGPPGDFKSEPKYINNVNLFSFFSFMSYMAFSFI